MSRDNRDLSLSDRSEGGKAVHIEDFAQIFGAYPHDKYKRARLRNIPQVIGIEGQEEDIAEFVRRLVSNTLMVPVYGFVSTLPYFCL